MNITKDMSWDAAIAALTTLPEPHGHGFNLKNFLSVGEHFAAGKALYETQILPLVDRVGRDLTVVAGYIDKAIYDELGDKVLSQYGYTPDHTTFKCVHLKDACTGDTFIVRPE